MYTYQYNSNSPRIKRVTKTITRTFDENENMIEEREEEETEYEYVGGQLYNTNPQPWTYPTTPGDNTIWCGTGNTGNIATYSAE